MKKLFTIFGLIAGVVAFAQENNVKISLDETQFNEVSMELTIESAEDLEETFKMEDLVELMDMSNGKSAKFKLTCRGERMTNGEFSTMSYAIEQGNMTEKEFIRVVKKLRKSAIQY